jgi:hypothetical protein
LRSKAGSKRGERGDIVYLLMGIGFLDLKNLSLMAIVVGEACGKQGKCGDKVESSYLGWDMAILR